MQILWYTTITSFCLFIYVAIYFKRLFYWLFSVVFAILLTFLTDLFKTGGESEDQNGDGKVDFGTHEVTVKTGLDFSETGLFLAPTQAREFYKAFSNLQVFCYKVFYYDQTITVSDCDNL